jgi:uncharacterized membrane protein YdjX (TVP38/TMEM64 family)
MRLLLIFLILATVVLVTFFIWGDFFETFFTYDGTVTWLKDYGQWAWAIGIILLMSDLLLPLPATLIMAALGFIYGPVAGGLVAATGSFMAGSLAYWLCRLLGENTAIWLLGKKDYERGKKLAVRLGGFIVALSRWLPVFPEVIACMAGLTRMPPARFHIALLCGSLPLGFIYALVGHSGNTNPILAFTLSAIVPVLIWLGLQPLFRSHLKERQ